MMNPGRRFFHIAALLILLVPLAVTSTPPHIDWYLFRVSGHVVRPAGSLDNYTVVLMKYDVRRNQDGWARINECIVGRVDRQGPLVPVTLTNANGGFALSVAACDDYYGDIEHDTLAVAILLPDTVLMGTPFRVNSVQRIAVEGKFEGDSPCDDGYTYVDGYIYSFPPRDILVP